MPPAERRARRRHAVAVEVVRRSGRHHVDQRLHLDLVVNRSEAVEQRQSGTARVDVAGDGDLVGLGLQLVDQLLGGGDLGGQLGLLGVQLVDDGLLVEVHLGGSVGPLAGVGDLSRSFAGSPSSAWVIAGAHHAVATLITSSSVSQRRIAAGRYQRVPRAIRRRAPVRVACRAAQAGR